MATIIYGIPTCDSVRKARQWLNAQDIEHTFVDVRESPPSKALIDEWLARLGAEKLVNKRSTTWKNMSDIERHEAQSGDTAAVLIANPTLIKRPVLSHGSVLDVGFKADTYRVYFQ